VLAQAFGDTVIVVATRSPLVTEDPRLFRGLFDHEGREKIFPALRDLWTPTTSLDKLSDGVYPATELAMEYLGAAEKAFSSLANAEQVPFSAGYAAKTLPFPRQEGFGDLGVQVLVVNAGGQTTAYVLFDGNNMQTGAREEIRKRLLARVDECEVMTTDTHVVNTVSGRNQVGLRIGVDKFYPYVDEALSAGPCRYSSCEICRRNRVVPGDRGLWLAEDLAARVHGKRYDGISPAGRDHSPCRGVSHDRNGILPAGVLKTGGRGYAPACTLLFFRKRSPAYSAIARTAASSES